MLEQVIDFLREHDIHKVSELLRQLDWNKLLRTPMLWLIAVPTLGLIVWKRKFRFLLLVVSFGLLVGLSQYVLPGKGEPIPLKKLLSFLGLTVAIALVNLYFLMIRRD